MNMPNLPEVSCLEDLLIVVSAHCVCVAAIDAPLTMIVVCVRRASVAAIDAPLTKIVVAG